MIFLTIFCVPTVFAQGTKGHVGVTVNAHVDGTNNICKGNSEKCHVFSDKEFVWLDGSRGLGPDGEYFFAVLSPDGAANPNDGAETNLSDNSDCYLNRTFTVTNGAVSAYSGYACGSTYPLQTKHWLDNGISGGTPNWTPPYIRLYPFADTTNAGGIYTLAVCSLAEGYPVDPSNCSYTAFRIAEGE